MTKARQLAVEIVTLTARLDSAKSPEEIDDLCAQLEEVGKRLAGDPDVSKVRLMDIADFPDAQAKA